VSAEAIASTVWGARHALTRAMRDADRDDLVDHVALAVESLDAWLALLQCEPPASPEAFDHAGQVPIAQIMALQFHALDRETSDAVRDVLWILRHVHAAGVAQ